MAEEIDFENGKNSNFERLVTLTLTYDPAIRHIVLQQSSTSTYIPNFIQIEETFCGRTDVRTYGRTFFPSILLGRLSEVDLKIEKIRMATIIRDIETNERQRDKLTTDLEGKVGEIRHSRRQSTRRHAVERFSNQVE